MNKRQPQLNWNADNASYAAIGVVLIAILLQTIYHFIV